MWLAWFGSFQNKMLNICSSLNYIWCHKMTNGSRRNFHVLTTCCPLELGQQILVFPVSDKFLMIVYLNVCLFGSLSALPNWETPFPIELGHHIQSAYCYFCLEGDPRGSVPVLPLKDSLIRTGKSLRGHFSLDCTGQDCPAVRPSFLLVEGDKRNWFFGSALLYVNRDRPRDKWTFLSLIPSLMCR